MAVNLLNLPNLSNVTSWQDLRKWSAQAFTAIGSAFNGNISFEYNLDIDGPHSISFPGSTMPIALMHSLGRVPIGFIVINRDGTNLVYQPNVNQFPWTTTQVFLQASGAVNVSLFLL